MQRLSNLIVLGVVFGVQVGAEPMVAGQVRLASGESVASAQVRLFDLRDLRSWVGTTTDETGSFALPVGALPGAAVLPEGFHLGSNYPNPFNPSTVIPYHLPRSMPVRLEVFNVLGQRIATLVDGERPSGFHTARWDATNAAGQAVAAGMYLYRLSSEGVQVTRSMVLIDGQAGMPAGSAAALPETGAEATEAASVYGLTVSGPGLMPFVDPAFRVAAGPVELVVEASAGLSRAKAASSCGVLGDVDNNDGVDFFDALLAALHSMDSSIVLPNNGDISQGDVNADGRIDFTDAYLIARWLNDPSDPTLPAGIGEAACSDDRAMLVALYEATDGDNWENNTHWLSDKPLGEWYGVTTDENGRVIRLQLVANRLSGALPSSLGDLTNLHSLHLNGNALSGSLPSSLGDLTNLTWLDLNGNDFSGVLPAELGDLTNLEVMWLERNQLSGVLPAELGDLTNLVGLDLSSNDFSGSLPSSLGDLTNLIGLDLGRNQLSGVLPAELGDLTKLLYLGLYNTQLCAPTDAAFQRWLEGINTEGVVNCGEEVPDPINPNRAALLALYEATDGENWTDNTNWLSNKPLGEWFGVEAIAMMTMEWIGVIPDRDGEVVSLELRNNRLSGALPSSLGDLGGLLRLDLGSNQLSGALPAELVNLTYLHSLHLDNTQLCAPLDADFQAWLQGIGDKVGVVDCSDEEGDRAQLVEMRREIDALIGDAAGASIEDCRYMALGDKPCGGPWEYVIYSVSSTDSEVLAERVAAYNDFQEEMNRRYMYFSDCMYVTPPVLVYRDGRCLAE